MPEVELGIVPLIVLVVYLAMMIGIGWLGKVRRRDDSLSDFYLGGSNLGMLVLFLTLFATQYSGNTLLGFAGTAYREGGTYVVSVLFMTLAITTMTIYGPRLVRLARIFGYVTPADFIFHRYGSHALRVVCVMLLCWGLANYILEQLVAMGHAVEAVSGGRVPFMAGVVLLVIVMLIYESLGGMRSVAWTDTIQGILLFGGCTVILYLLLTNEGGLGAAAADIAERVPEKFDSPDAGELRVWVSRILLLGFGVAVYPHAIQRMFAARSVKTLRTSIAGMAFMPFATTFLAFLIGIMAISRLPDLSNFDADKVTLFMLASIIDVNPIAYALVVLVLVALVAAIMSTSDSALLTIQSMMTKDIYKTYLNKDASPKHLLVTGKLFGWGLMAFLVTQAWLSREFELSIWQLIKLKLEFMVQISPVLILGVHWKRLTGTAALAGVLVGTAFTLVVWVGAAFGFWDNAWRSPWGVSAGVWGLGLNYLTLITVTYLGPKRDPA